MRKHIGRIFAALVCLCVCVSAVAAAEPAYIDNGKDPASRLNLRSAPGTDAASLGKFVSGTQVEIVAEAGGGWVQVEIGGGVNRVSGYMKAEYLRPDASGVLDARREMTVVSPYGTPAVVLRDRPGNSYDAVAMLAVGEKVKVIGASGEFSYVQTADQTVGCLAGNELK